MPRGSDSNREREYDELKHRFHKEHRYPGREEEVAARIVNKQRKQYGETKGERRKDEEGKSPDRNLPIDNYQHLRADQVARRISGCSKKQLDKIEHYEKGHKNRKTVLSAIEKERD